jgi:hypothetical protein
VPNRQESEDENNSDGRQPDQVFPAIKDFPHSAGARAGTPPFYCGFIARLSKHGGCRPSWRTLTARGSVLLRGIARKDIEALR